MRTSNYNSWEYSKSSSIYLYMFLVAAWHSMIKYMISESENKIMEFLWNEKDGLSFSEITNLLNQDNSKVLVKQTINTFLTRMIAKNLITKKTGDTRFKTRYYSKYTKEEYHRKVCEDILSNMKVPF